MKKGQVTLLVIIGIILLFTVSAMLFVSRVTYGDRLQSQARETVNEYIEANSINQYVTSCLDRVAVEGLRLIASQGGVLYDYQGGITPTDTNFLEGEHYYPYTRSGEPQNVSYTLVDVSQDYCLSYYPQLPVNNFVVEELSFYPVERLSFSEYATRFLSPVEKGCAQTAGTKDLRKSGYLGYSRLPLLCRENSDNIASGISFGSPICKTEYQQSETVDPSIEHPSIQQQLEVFIAENMKVCFDPSFYEERGDEITVDLDESSINLQFIDPSGILLQSTFPFEVAIKGQRPIVEFVDFQQSINLNFLQTYDFIYDLTTTMAKDPGFDLVRGDYTTLASYRASFEVDLIEGACASCGPYDWPLDDVLRIRDTDTTLRGEPYDFFLAFKQRKPVLDYIHNPDQNFLFNGQEIDFLFYEGEAIDLEPKAIDPNYDQYEINFVGWKETTDTILDLNCCRANPLCTLNDYDMCLITTADYPQLDFNCCRDNFPASCNLAVLQAGSTICSQPENFEAKVWSTSLETNNGNLNYVVQPTDVGLHTFTVSVEDEHGATDFQNVRVLIYDSPIATLTPENPYHDISDLYASIEDPYTFVADQSQASVFSSETDVSFFVYRIEEEGVEVKTDESSFLLPNESYTISDILPKVFSNTVYDALLDPLNSVSQITLQGSLTVEQTVLGDLISSPESLTDIYVSECLPHGFYNPTSGFDFNALEQYSIVAYENDGTPYYATYQERPNNYNSLTLSQKQQIDDALFTLPHVCCEPQPIPINQNEFTQLQGGAFAEDTELCYQNIDYQTCYPPRDQLLQELYLLKNPSLVTDTGEVIPFSRTEHNTRYGTIETNPANDPGIQDPYIISNGVLGDAINNIYEVTHNQYCSGNRGNVCGGRIELQWNEVANCEDLDSGIDQYARCSGPGLPSDLLTRDENSDGEADYVGGGNFVAYAGNPLRSSVSGFQCQGGDATQAINVSLVCQEFNTIGTGTGQSFEKEVLRINEFNRLGLAPTTAEYIGDGYCAGPERSTINSRNNFNTGTNGPYNCFAICDASAGGCSYERTQDCFCEHGNNVCDDIPARYMYETGYESFACAGQTACGNTCQISANPQRAEPAKDACYCQVNAGDTAISNFEYSSFPNYFGDKIASGNWQHNGQGSCCAGNNLYVTATSSISGNNICFDGRPISSGIPFSHPNYYRSGVPVNNLLSYNGQVYYCAQTDVCVDDSFTVQDNGLQCVHLTSGSSCAMDYYVANAPCCSLGSGACTDNDFCTNNPTAACCQAGGLAECRNGNTACTSTGTIIDQATDCDQLSTADPLIDQVRTSDNYVQHVIQEGGVVGGRTCSGGSW